MKSDFLLAITQLSAEKNLSKEVVLGAVEAALVSAYRKDNFTPDQNISVKINPNTGKVEVWAEKTVVESPSDSRSQISLDEARQVKEDVQLDDVIVIEATPRDAGRIAAQTAKQVILQRLHEAEHNAIYEEYTDREEDIITGLVQRIEPNQILIDLGRTEAVLPAAEQPRNERYRVGQRLKVYLLEVVRASRGPRLIVSRSHPNLLRRLFELEVPEVLSGVVEIKAIARDAGYRSKVAVVTRQEGVDPVGCCVGLRGIRIQNIVNELNGEKLDVVLWHPDVQVFVANAISPARVSAIELSEEEGIATVIVPDRQLSLAIGREGQNARLAAKLTGWRIDIKSVSAAEAERLAEAQLLAETEAQEAVEVAEVAVVEPSVEEPIAAEAVVEEPAEPLPDFDTAFTPSQAPVEPQKIEGEGRIRFAEDVLTSAPPKPGARKREKKKKRRPAKEPVEGASRPRKRRIEAEVLVDDEEF